jgi:hypothetical protein
LLNAIEATLTTHSRVPDIDNRTRSVALADEILNTSSAAPMTTTRLGAAYRQLVAAWPDDHTKVNMGWDEQTEAEIWERLRRLQPDLPPAYAPRGLGDDYDDRPVLRRPDCVEHYARKHELFDGLEAGVEAWYALLLDADVQPIGHHLVAKGQAWQAWPSAEAVAHLVGEYSADSVVLIGSHATESTAPRDHERALASALVHDHGVNLTDLIVVGATEGEQWRFGFYSCRLRGWKSDG